FSVNSLGVDADEAAVLKKTGQSVRYQPRSRRVFNSVEFVIRGGTDAAIQVMLQDRDDPQITLKKRFSVKDILAQKEILPISQTAAQLIVQQAPGDYFVL